MRLSPPNAYYEPYLVIRYLTQITLKCAFDRTYLENKNTDYKHTNSQQPPVFLAVLGRFSVREKHKHLWYNVDMKENKPITILLYEDDLPKLCEIRCINCSRMLCKVNAHVKSISFGDGYDPESQREMVSGMNVVEQKCRGCDCIYKFLFQK